MVRCWLVYSPLRTVYEDSIFGAAAGIRWVRGSESCDKIACIWQNGTKLIPKIFFQLARFQTLSSCNPSWLCNGFGSRVPRWKPTLFAQKYVVVSTFEYSGRQEDKDDCTLYYQTHNLLLSTCKDRLHTHPSPHTSSVGALIGVFVSVHPTPEHMANRWTTK